MNEFSVVGPVQIRKFHLEKTCESHQGHLHHYDHVTVALEGAVDVISEDGTVSLHAAVPTPGAAVRCGPLRLWVAAPGVEHCPVSSCVLVATRNFTVTFRYKENGQPVEGSRAFEKHVIPKIAPGVLWSVDVPVLVIDTLDPELSKDMRGEVAAEHGENFALVKAEKAHTVKAKTDDARYACIFAHRDFDGLVVQDYNGNLKASDLRVEPVAAEVA